MAERRYTYDSACEDLAEHFLIDGPATASYSRDVFDLAQHIQDAVEAWLAGRTAEPIEQSNENVA